MVGAFTIFLVGFHSIVKGRTDINLLMISDIFLDIFLLSQFLFEQIDFGLELVEGNGG
jgi:hypothetical protein